MPDTVVVPLDDLIRAKEAYGWIDWQEIKKRNPEEEDFIEDLLINLRRLGFEKHKDYNS